MIRELYQQRLAQQRLAQDPAQAAAVECMQSLFDELLDLQRRSARPLARLARRFGLGPRAPGGMYLWGGVGRGKTVLMNLFHEALPFEDKQRLHFHHFMLGVHADLAELQRSGSDRRNPLRSLARQYADRYRVICLDEFIVTNITDAMLLYGLLDALLRYGVVIIATSNRVPDDLYQNGLQRERFLPAIGLIKRRMQVLHLDSGTDHRAALLSSEGLYHSPLDERTEAEMAHEFEALATADIEHDGSISVQHRSVAFVAMSEDIIWFSFDVLCDAPRAAADYIEIADRFHTVFLSGVPVMDEDTDDKARRFIYLIDEFYQSNVTLVMSAADEPERLYQGDMLAFAFRRTASRLNEMQSDSYIARNHRRPA